MIKTVLTNDQLRAALERWYWLLQTELLCLDNPAETDWGAVASVAAQTRAALATPPAMDGPAAPQEGRGLAAVEGKPGDEEWDALVERAWDKYKIVGHQGELFMYASNFDNALDLVREELTRWSRSTTPAPVEGEGGGPSVAEIDAAYLATWCEESGRYDIVAFALDILSRWGRPAAAAPAPVEGEAVPEGREPAAVAPEASDWFKVALIAQDMRSRGLAEQAAGDELLKLANERRTPPVPAPVPAPVGGEVGELVAKLRRLSCQNPLGTADPTITRAAALLQQQATELAALRATERAALVPVLVSERPWERPGWCDEDGNCWFRSSRWGTWSLEKVPPKIPAHCLSLWCLPHWAIPQPPPGGGGGTGFRIRRVTRQGEW